MSTGKVIIFSAPSGSGKTTIVKHLLETNSNLAFSVSATTRKPRPGEVNGKDYYFLTNTDFLQRVQNNEFAEHEEVYPGTYYGTLRSEVERIWAIGKVVVFDVDVVGGLNLKRIWGSSALAVFVKPPSIEVLQNRLKARATETEQDLEKRVHKAISELKYEPKFDVVLINDRLEETFEKAHQLLQDFLTTAPL
ncbi:MAG: guanylate kinase [Bacteroidia bacterium]|nr:guanylate kinase [Bacteroidia bacterium]